MLCVKCLLVAATVGATQGNSISRYVTISEDTFYQEMKRGESLAVSGSNSRRKKQTSSAGILGRAWPIRRKSRLPLTGVTILVFGVRGKDM